MCEFLNKYIDIDDPLAPVRCAPLSPHARLLHWTQPSCGTSRKAARTRASCCAARLRGRGAHPPSCGQTSTAQTAAHASAASPAAARTPVTAGLAGCGRAGRGRGHRARLLARQRLLADQRRVGSRPLPRPPVCPPRLLGRAQGQRQSSHAPPGASKPRPSSVLRAPSQPRSVVAGAHARRAARGTWSFRRNSAALRWTRATRTRST